MNVELNVPDAVKAILVRALTDLAAVIDTNPGMADEGCVLTLRPVLPEFAAVMALAGLGYALQSASFASNDPDGYGGGVASLDLGGEFLSGPVTDSLTPEVVESLDLWGEVFSESPAELRSLLSDDFDRRVAAKTPAAE